MTATTDQQHLDALYGALMSDATLSDMVDTEISQGLEPGQADSHLLGTQQSLITINMPNVESSSMLGSGISGLRQNFPLFHVDVVSRQSKPYCRSIVTRILDLVYNGVIYDGFAVLAAGCRTAGPDWDGDIRAWRAVIQISGEYITRSI